jgi:hypothetical protein
VVWVAGLVIMGGVVAMETFTDCVHADRTKRYSSPLLLFFYCSSLFGSDFLLRKGFPREKRAGARVVFFFLFNSFSENKYENSEIKR